MRTVRVVLVIPSLFALTYEGFGNLQMALFAAFGGFASLIFASFGGTRRDKVVAHLGLAVTGSIGLIIGTAVSGITGWPSWSRSRSRSGSSSPAWPGRTPPPVSPPRCSPTCCRWPRPARSA